MTTILVVDDEANLVELVQSYLEREGYLVVTATDGPSALEAARVTHPDLIVLDVMLPGLDGAEVCRRLRQFTDAYVIMLTARSEEVDKIIGLTVGADDYLTKPFSPRELVARVKARLRRPRVTGRDEDDWPDVHRFGELVIDEGRYEVTLAGAAVPMTAREFALLATLARQPRRALLHLPDENVDPGLVWREAWVGAEEEVEWPGDTPRRGRHKMWEADRDYVKIGHVVVALGIRCAHRELGQDEVSPEFQIGFHQANGSVHLPHLLATGHRERSCSGRARVPRPRNRTQLSDSPGSPRVTSVG